MLQGVVKRSRAEHETLTQRKQACYNQLDRLRRGRPIQEQECTNFTLAAASTVQAAISRILLEESEGLVARPTNRFRDREQAFDPKDLSAYTRNLSVYVESELQPTLMAKCSAQISEAYESSLHQINVRLEELVPVDMRSVSSSSSITTTSSTIAHNSITAAELAARESVTPSFIMTSRNVPFNSSFALDCSALSATFTPDVKFRFSLGISTLVPRVARIAAPLAAHFGLRKELDPDAPDFDTLETLSVVADVFRSPFGAVAMTVGSMAFSRSLPLKLVLYGSVVYSALYIFEWACYTRSAQISKLKHQFVEHIESELRVLSRHRSYSCGQAVQSSLADQTRMLYSQLDGLESKLATDIQDASAALERLDVITTGLQSQSDTVGELLVAFEDIMVL
jgi:hypothetical protein